MKDHSLSRSKNVRIALISFLFTWLFFDSTCLSGQTCLPGGITFTTQQQIDDFPADYPGCSEILGNVVVSGQTLFEITSLDSLYSITAIHGNITMSNCYNLPNMQGLHNLVTIGGAVTFHNNDGHFCIFRRKGKIGNILL